jgi:hypothetical protein
MLYRKNMGGKERAARLLGGALIVACWCWPAAGWSGR